MKESIVETKKLLDDAITELLKNHKKRIKRIYNMTIGAV